jgi:hypothetical protein
MADPELMARLAAIEERLAALEERGALPRVAALAPQPVDSASNAPPIADRLTEVAPRSSAPPSVAALGALPSSAPPPPPPPLTLASVPSPLPRTEAASSAPDRNREFPDPTEPKVDSSSPASLERFLGVQVAAWIGAIVVIAAIAIFAKFALDQGWLQRTPPAVKLAFAYGISAAFAIAGTLLRDRLGRLPAGALLAAGLGGLFVSTCAGVTPLNVLGPAPALLAGIACAIIAGALTLRSRELAVGAISLVGAYVVPVFANIYVFANRADGEPPIAGALYLTAVYGVALTLAWLGPANFAWLRFAGVFQAISGLLLLIDAGRSMPVLSLSFTALWWAMAVAECSLAAMRGKSPRLNTACTVAATSIAATLALRGAFATNPWVDLHSWLPLGMAGAAIAAALYLRTLVPTGGIDTHDRDEDPDASLVADAAARQATVLAILAGALVLAQVGVVVRGGALPVTWAVMGTASILIGRKLAQQPTAWIGVVSVLLGLAATALHAIITAGAAIPLIEYPADPTLRTISAWNLRLADTHIAPLIVAFALLFAARFWSIGGDPLRRASVTAGFLAACASLLWIGLSLAIGFSYTSVALLLAIPIAALLAGRTLSLIKLIALLGSMIAALGWFAATSLHVFEHIGTTHARPTGGAIAAALVIGAHLLLSRRFRQEKFSEIPTVIGFGFGLAALTMLLLVEQLAGPTTRSVTTATIWASVAVGVVSSVGAIIARTSGRELSEGLGLVAASLATAVALVTTIIDAAQPADSVRWVTHALVSPANIAIVVFAICAVALRGGFATSTTVRTTIALHVAAVTLVGSSAFVYRLFDPRVGPPFDASYTLQQSVLSVWLAVLAVGFVVFGFWRRARAARWTGLALLGCVAVKVLVLDMANAETIWRVAALFATGVLLVATSAVYSRAVRGVPTTDRPTAAPR